MINVNDEIREVLRRQAYGFIAKNNKILIMTSVRDGLESTIRTGPTANLLKIKITLHDVLQNDIVS